MHTNKINGKRYIGITCNKPEDRWGSEGAGYLRKQPNGKYSQPLFARAILKYGWESFETTLLFEGLSEAEAKSKEIELIASYHTYSKDPECWGYNNTPGGDGNRIYDSIEEAEAANKAKCRRWYEEHRQYCIDKANKYKQDNLEKVTEYQAKYKQNNKAYFSDKCKKRYAKNREAELADKKVYYTENRQQILDSKREYLSLVTTLRAQVRDLDAKYPDVISDEDRVKLQTAHGCRNKTYLYGLLQKFTDLNLSI
jgi:hypothetical protein